MYNPQPKDLTSINLPTELRSLVEEIAENVHDTWAQGRMNDGWTYGPRRNDEKKEHPCLVPYGELPELEKQYDRDTAISSIKMIIACGFTIIKK